MSDTIVTETLSGAIFTDSLGDTISLSGTWTTYYNADGQVENGGHPDGNKDEVLNLVATGSAGSTTFSSAYAPYNTPITDGNGVNDGYELLTNGSNNQIYSSLYFDYITEQPTSLAAALSGGLHSSIKDANGNTYTLTSPGTITCFTAGTAIATPGGPAAIETLAAGDLVSLSHGGAAPIRWIGRRAVATRFADPLHVLPIRIRAGALGNNLPLRDLLVSPCHALLIDDVLVHAGALVNGVSIVPETVMPEVFTYYHIELADHSLILAEGVAAESFVDNADRMAFDNWQEYQELHADATPIVEMTYPRVKARRQLPVRVRQKLAAVAAADCQGRTAA